MMITLDMILIQFASEVGVTLKLERGGGEGSLIPTQEFITTLLHHCVLLSHPSTPALLSRCRFRV